ncbi:hypothetical protein HPB47_014791 [Ixodes persulcatus]|uniref:Uncharacterized protein n=1 Tax=Ixodes persulcatus TaxID=34615 RepID=A0AC60QVD7_IXOPE|nr:hypothetical protein HPB47_014791 [Ixodes persulcatus]
MWSEGETWPLIRLWEDSLEKLRGEKHNAKVYDAIVGALAEIGIVKTRQQIISSMKHSSSGSGVEAAASDDGTTTPSAAEAADTDLTPCSPTDRARTQTEPPAAEPRPSTSSHKEQRRPCRKRKATSGQQFQEALLEKQTKMLELFDAATKEELALCEQQVRAQEKLVDLMAAFFNKS